MLGYVKLFCFSAIRTRYNFKVQYSRFCPVVYEVNKVNYLDSCVYGYHDTNACSND